MEFRADKHVSNYTKFRINFLFQRKFSFSGFMIFHLQRRMCGDVNDDGIINMDDVMTLWYDYADYPYPGAYEVNYK